MVNKNKQQKKRYWLRGGIIGIIIWLVLIGLFNISGLFFDCGATTYLGEGASCWNIVQEIIITIFYILSFPFIILGANPNLSSVGPSGVLWFWIGSFISFVLWGLIIGFIYSKIKNRKKSK